MMQEPGRLSQEPSIAEEPDLYVHDASDRYDAAVKYFERAGNPRLRWPYGSWGCGNPWLVLLGPSPGASPLKRTFESDPWANHNSVGFGPGACEVRFNEGGERRNRNWHALRLAAFSAVSQRLDPELLQSRLTAIMNLTHENAVCAARGDDIDALRERSCGTFLLPQLAQARPVVLLVLSKAAWVPFERYVRSHGLIREELPPGDHPRPKRNVMHRMLVQLAPDLGFPTAVMQVPVHPSMAFSREVDASAVRVALGPLLAAQS